MALFNLLARFDRDFIASLAVVFTDADGAGAFVAVALLLTGCVYFCVVGFQVDSAAEIFGRAVAPIAAAVEAARGANCKIFETGFVTVCAACAVCVGNCKMFDAIGVAAAGIAAVAPNAPIAPIAGAANAAPPISVAAAFNGLAKADSFFRV